jgi:hypothetical protein
MTATHSITLALTEDEALVLFEWLARFNQQSSISFDDQAEERVLYDLESQLETLLVAPFAATTASGSTSHALASAIRKRSDPSGGGRREGSVRGRARGIA